MDELAELVARQLPHGWEMADPTSFDSPLVCPCGEVIEQDGACPEGCVSPLHTAGWI